MVKKLTSTFLQPWDESSLKSIPNITNLGKGDPVLQKSEDRSY